MMVPDKISRRDFLKLGSLLAAGAAFGPGTAQVLAAGLEKLSRTTRVVWLQGLSCTGDSISLLNSADPDPADLLTKYISLVLHQTIGAAQGRQFMGALEQAAELGDYILVVEGAVPLGMPEACRVGGSTFNDLLLRLIPKARLVLAVGTCAAFGGVPAAEGNPTGAVGVREFMERHNLPLKGRLLNAPGCPTHPKTIVSLLAYAAAKGYPEVDPVLLIPRTLFGASTHDECPRYHQFERKIFAKYLGDPEGCLFKLGCLGPLTHTQCPQRQWNGGVNWCIRAAAPCIGCTSPDFSRRKDFPFYRKSEQTQPVNYTEKDRGGASS